MSCFVQPNDIGPVRVCLRDTTRMATQLLADVFRRDKRFEVVDLADRPEEFVPGNVDVAVVSCAPARSEELELLRRLRGLEPSVKPVALMDEPGPSDVLQVFRAGARGIFCRSSSYKLLPKCVLKINNGHIWATQSQLEVLADAVGRPFPMPLLNANGVALLAPREQHVVYWVAEGLGNREIAQRMQLSEHTVKNYLFRIFDKLGVSSRAELVLYASSHAGVRSEPVQFPCVLQPPQDGEGFCELYRCLLTILRVSEKCLQSPSDIAAPEQAYMHACMADALTEILAEQTRAALRHLEMQLPPERLSDIRKCADEKARKAAFAGQAP